MITIFDTETTSLEKPFCYNIGFIIADQERDEVAAKEDWIAEQIWHNRELFTTAYYADKREGYVESMRAKRTKMDKLGYITQRMCRLFKEHEVTDGYAYNSPFDDGVFKYNCDWFKIKNPFDNIAIHDIRGYVHNFIAFTPEYQQFCEEHEYFTEAGNYATTAEIVYRFIKQDTGFIEAHTALADSEIEFEILKYCISKGAEWGQDYKVYRSIPRKGIEKKLLIKDTQGESHVFDYERMTFYKEKNNQSKIILK